MNYYELLFARILLLLLKRSLIVHPYGCEGDLRNEKANQFIEKLEKSIQEY